MSRTKKNERGKGAEYWSRRPLSNAKGAVPGKATKTITHRKERQAARREAEAAKASVHPRKGARP